MASPPAENIVYEMKRECNKMQHRGAAFFQRVEKLFRHADGLLRKAPKTSNSHSSAYTSTVECELRSNTAS